MRKHVDTKTYSTMLKGLSYAENTRNKIGIIEYNNTEHILVGFAHNQRIRRFFDGNIAFDGDQFFGE